MAYNAKLIVQGSSEPKFYMIFKYANFGSLTAPEALIMLFGNGIPLQRVILMFYRKKKSTPSVLAGIIQIVLDL